MKNKSSAWAILLLLLATVIWGTAFLAQDKGADHVESFTFIGIRFLIGGIFLIPLIKILDIRKRKGESRPSPSKSERRDLIVGGAICGVVLAVASYFQQAGLGGMPNIEATSPAKAGFITALYILFVPLLALFFKKKTPAAFWICIAVATVGFYFLCLYGNDLSIKAGDALMLVASFAFSLHIILIDLLAKRCDPIKFSCAQFLTTGIICTVMMLIFEAPSWESIISAAFPIIYAGLFSTGIAFTIQVVSQKHLHPTLATLIMSLEAVFALLAGIIFDYANNVPSLSEAIGSALIFAAVILAQIFAVSKEKIDNSKEQQNEAR